MHPGNRNVYRTQSKGKLLGLIFLGCGLLILGIAAVLILPKPALPATFSDDSVIPLEVKFTAPDVSLSDIQGRTNSLSDYRGKVVLVNNWATWCPPCKAEMPDLQAFYEAHKTQNFELIGIEAGETAGEVSQFIKQYGLTFPIWLDPNNKSLDAFHNQALPNSYVIDKTGVVRLAWSGAISLKMLEKYVDPLFKE
jgi:cytochrome c biogenesis protein CcmG, thiol:disulfide interchange protein DsbE